MREDDPLAWADYAEEDFATARSALRAQRPRLVTACFHSQQCAEKYLKAMLLKRQAVFPKTHDLLHLNTLCLQNGVYTPFSETFLAQLAGYAVTTRYPGEEPLLEEARAALEIARVVRKFARKWMGIA